MLDCVICGAAHFKCGGPSTSTPIDLEVSTVVVSQPRMGTVNTEAPDMVRVQLKPNDVRSYRRRDAEQILASTPGAFIVGEQAEDVSRKAKRAAPNKARTTAPSQEPDPPAPVETKAEGDPPAGSDGQTGQ